MFLSPDFYSLQKMYIYFAGNQSMEKKLSNASLCFLYNMVICVLVSCEET